MGWQLPDGTLERPISGMHLRPFEIRGNAPVVRITRPDAGENFAAPASIQITAEASDEDGYIEKVEFYNEGKKIGEDLNARQLWRTGTRMGSSPGHGSLYFLDRER